VDCIDTRWLAAMDWTWAAVRLTVCVWVAVPRMSRSSAPPAVSWAAVITATCPWFAEIEPCLSPLGGVVVVVGIVPGVWLLQSLPPQPERVIPAPWIMASTASSVNSLRPIFIVRSTMEDSVSSIEFAAEVEANEPSQGTRLSQHRLPGGRAEVVGEDE